MARGQQTKITVAERVCVIEKELLNNATRKDILEKYKKLYNVKNSTIDKYIAQASENIRERLERDHSEEIKNVQTRLVSLSIKAVDVFDKALDLKYKGKPTANAINAAKEVLKKTIGDKVSLEHTADENTSIQFIVGGKIEPSKREN